MTDIKALLEQAGMPVAELSFRKSPKLPYLIFDVREECGGADYKINIFNRDVTVELYSAKVDKTAEENIEKILREKSIHYSKERIWITKDEFLQTIYDFSLVEK